MNQEHASQSLRTYQFRIGLLVDSVQASKYVYDFAKWAQTRHDILAVTHLILHTSTQPTTPAGKPNNFLAKLFTSLKNNSAYRMLSTALFKLIVKGEGVSAQKERDTSKSFGQF